MLFICTPVVYLEGVEVIVFYGAVGARWKLAYGNHRTEYRIAYCAIVSFMGLSYCLFILLFVYFMFSHI